MTDTIDPAQLERDLAGFTGSQTYTRHWLVRAILLSEGMTHLCEAAGAFWLADVIVSHQMTASVRAEEFQVWALTCNEDGRGAVVVATDGNDNKIARQDIGFTDFPLKGITVWFANRTMYLPSEH